jgi:hypothetical protein
MPFGMGFLSKKPGIFTGGAYVPTVFVGMYATQAPSPPALGSPSLLRGAPSPARGEGWGIAFNR